MSTTKDDKAVLQKFVSGGLAGACSRTMVAPLDRIKILLQTASKKGNMKTMFSSIVREEGLMRLWKGNALNCIRIVPYSALQFGTYESFKRRMTPESGEMTVSQRLTCGTMAGLVAASFTHPIDVIRHRIMLDPLSVSTRSVTAALFRESGYRALFKGYGSTVFSLTPFVAVNFCAFDTMKHVTNSQTSSEILLLGAASALISQTICYPLDTVRRRMQIPNGGYKHGLDALLRIVKDEGIRRLYSGLSANALKIVPNNSIRFLVYYKVTESVFKN